MENVTKARAAFVLQAKKNIDEILATKGDAAAQGKWFKRVVDGRYKVTFWNGSRILELRPGITYFYLKDADSASVFIAKAMVAAECGDLDKFFIQQAPTTRARSKRSVDAKADLPRRSPREIGSMVREQWEALVRRTYEGKLKPEELEAKLEADWLAHEARMRQG